MSTYTVALLTQIEAEDLTKVDEKAFWNEDADEYYTYEDVAPSAPTTVISQTVNDNTLMGVISGTGPVYKKPRRPMYPR